MGGQFILVSMYDVGPIPHYKLEDILHLDLY